VKAGREHDAVDRAVEAARPVEVLVVEGLAVGDPGEVGARAQRQRRPGCQQLGARVGGDLEAARPQVDPGDRDAIDLDGATQQVERVLGCAQLQG